MGCPCCDIIFKDNEGNDILRIPHCEICKYEAPLPERRMVLFLKTYHVDCLKKLLEEYDKRPPKFDPTIL